MPRIACIVPTYNGKATLERLLDSLEDQSTGFDTFLVDSSSSDGSAEQARIRDKDVKVIPSSAFSHGGTRQMMADLLPDYDVYVYMTQDAYLESKFSIERIVAPFVDAEVGAVCGRQLPHRDATLLAQHARTFNYPGISQVKTMADIPSLGLKAAFISNSFAAYRATALTAVGGFPSHVILAEDMYVAAKMLVVGWKVFYASDAECRHSHNYSMLEEFRRYFDIGVFHARESWLRELFGGARGEGLRYVISELKFLGVSRLHLWPMSILRNGGKLLGYMFGKQDSRLPTAVKRVLSMHRRYWDGPFASPPSKKPPE
jgi:rhamnosyltransferase